MPKERVRCAALGSTVRITRPSLLLFAVLCTACASSSPGTAPPATAPTLPTSTAYEAGFANQPSSVRDTILSEPRSRVWAVLPGVLQELGVEASTRDEGAFVIGNQGWRPTAIHGTRLSAFLRCGAGLTGPNADSYEVTSLLLVQLEAPAATETLVRIVLDAYARPRTSSGAEVRCVSVGTLEARVVRLIGEHLAQPDPSQEGVYGTVALEGSPATPASRLPRAGDVLRVTCVGPAGEERAGQGDFVAAVPGVLTLGLGPTRPGVAFPAASVQSIQIRERHSHAKLGAFLGGLVGLATGGYVGHSSYDPEGLTHYRQGTVTAIGAIVGGVAGAVVGAIAGWFVAEEEWIEVPSAWWARGVPASETQVPQPAPSCPSFVD